MPRLILLSFWFDATGNRKILALLILSLSVLLLLFVLLLFLTLILVLFPAFVSHCMTPFHLPCSNLGLGSGPACEQEATHLRWGRGKNDIVQWYFSIAQSAALLNYYVQVLFRRAMPLSCGLSAYFGPPSQWVLAVGRIQVGKLLRRDPV